MKKGFFTLPKLGLTLAVVALAIAFSACNKNSNEQRFKDAAMKLDQTEFDMGWEYDYWPNGGIRNIGGHLASLISLGELEAMLPCPLYVSGPHHDGEWDLYNGDFGHYNPQAIQYLADLAKKVTSDKTFIEASKPLVDRYLYRQMLCMMVIHDVMYHEDYFEPEYREYLFNEAVKNYGYSEEIYYYLNSISLPELDSDESYLYSNFNYEFFYWWARRWSDGTADQFYDGLSTVFKAYHPEYEFDINYYYWPFEYGDDWFEGDEGWYFDDDSDETTYAVELESDEPIADNERIKEKDAIEMLKGAALKLDQTFDAVNDVFDYWPECGLRNTAGHLFSLISMRTLNRILPCDLYVSGPHYTNRWNLESSWDFGHYNPEAIEYLNKLARKIVSDEKFVENTRPLVDEYLKRQMFILKGLYDGLNNKDICPDKQAVLDNIMALEGETTYDWNSNLAGQFMSEVDLEDETYVYGNTGGMFLYWWARRNSDGTMELFHEGLETIYNAYYPAE